MPNEQDENNPLLEPDELLVKDAPIQNEDPTKPLKLSIDHEEELVVKAIKLGSAANAIKWYYQTYRPENFKSHNEKKDWKKNCRIKYQTVQKWMIKYNKVGCHLVGGTDRPRPSSHR